MVLHILQFVEYGLLAVCGATLLYLVFLTILALCAPRYSISSTKPLHRRFAFVVPAHNEELVIARTINNLLEVDYPQHLFAVIVIADNCTDSTAAISATCGAKVLVRTDPIRKSKGHALAWGFQTLLSNKGEYDAFVVVDADSIALPSFLRIMHDVLDQGAEAVQAADIVDPQPGSWSPEVSRIALLLYNFVRPLGRKVIGCSAGLRGNGMCFTSDLLRRVPWNAFSLAEDLEFGLRLLLNGTRVQFAPEAVVRATMPNDPKNAAQQRARWEGGRWPVVRRYALPLIVQALRTRSWATIDAFIDLLTPPFANMTALAFFAILFRLCAVLIGLPVNSDLMFLWSVVLTLGFLHVGLGLWAANADRLLLRAVVYFPKYVLWKIGLYTRATISTTRTEWIRTTREQPESHISR